MRLSKTKNIVLSVAITGFIGLVIFGNMAMAQLYKQNIPGVETPSGAPQTVGGIVDIIRAIVRWVYIIFFILAVLFILFAAFNYLTAGGEAEKVSKAKNQLIYAAVAIAVALLAVAFSTIIAQFLSSPQA